MSIEVKKKGTLKSARDEDYSLTELNANHSNRQALNKNVIFVNVITNILLHDSDCQNLPTNLQLIEKLAILGLPIKSKNNKSGYSKASVTVYIKPIICNS